MVQLRREKSRIDISATIWAMTLELARLCGWMPAGTRRIDVSGESGVDALRDVRHILPWQTEYVSNDGQTVTAADGMRFSESLIRATTQADRLLADWMTGKLEPPAGLRTPATGFRWFSTAEGKHHLQKLADFCAAGEFQIF